MRDCCSSLENILHFKGSSLRAVSADKKWGMKLLAPGCPSLLITHSLCVSLQPTRTGGSGILAGFKALRELSCRPPRGSSSPEGPSADSGSGASSEGPLSCCVNWQLLLRAELPGVRPHQGATHCHLPVPGQPGGHKNPPPGDKEVQGTRPPVTKQAQCGCPRTLRI